jgi:hypothetical protein
MPEEKKINKKATIQNIMDWAGRSIGHSINVKKFNAAMEKPDWETSLKEIANGCKVEIVYEP